MGTDYSESILLSVKKLRNIAPDDTNFDIDLIQDINTAFSILCQLGVGPAEGFAIYGPEEQWNDFASGELLTLRMVRSYVESKVRLLFDPPSSGAHMESLKQIVKELEWRLNVECDVNPESSSESSTRRCAKLGHL